MQPSMSTLKRWVTGWKFPASALSLLLSVSAFIGVILLIPETDGPLGRFARDFRLYCFGYDLKSGRFPWSEAILFFLDPLVIAGIIYFFWRKNLSHVPRALLLRTGFIVFLLTFASGGLLAYQAIGKRDFTFPAKGLRTSFKAPPVRLTDQAGTIADIADYRGRVVVLTGFYTHCNGTCPAIIGQLKRLVDALPPQKRDALSIFAVTMTPELDTVERLRHYAEGRKMQRPLYRLLTGDPSAVSTTLDLMGVTRSKPDARGQVDHANVILVVDKSGKVAYRFSLGDLQEKWLIESVLLLSDEAYHE
jgi:protein SCO1/2